MAVCVTTICFTKLEQQLACMNVYHLWRLLEMCIICGECVVIAMRIINIIK